MGTFPHRLTVQKLPGLPTRIIALDCHPKISVLKSDPRRSIHTLLGGALVCTDYCRGRITCMRQSRFTNSDGALATIKAWLRTRSITWVISHNLSYDLTLAGFWKWVEQGSIALCHFTLDDPPTVFHGTLSGCTLAIVDLLNYWRKPLVEIANSLGMPLSDDEGRCTSPAAAADLSLLHAHVVAMACSQLVSFLGESLGGGWKATAAGIAWSAFRSRKWGDRIRIHSDRDISQLERGCYYGGYVKAHYVGKWKKRVVSVDVNNLYGHQMYQGTYPTRLSRHSCTTPMAASRLLREGWCVCAGVRLDPSNDTYPYRDGGNTVYHGRGGFTLLAGPELLRACEMGIVREITRSAVYESGRPFQRFVEHFYIARTRQAQEGKKGAATLCKLITSCVFGRLGMLGSRWEHYPVVPPQRYCTWYEKSPDLPGQFTMCRSVAGVAERERVTGESPHSAVAIAAYVTAYGRQRMRQLREIAHEDSVLYEDTDCLHVTQSGLDRLQEAGEIHPTRLGALKVVSDSQWAEYWGPKSYAMDGVEVHAGLSSQARRVADGLYLQDKKAGFGTVPSLGPRDWVEVWSEPYSVD